MSRRSRVARVLITVLVGGLVAFHFGAKPALAWGGVNLVLEGWLVYLQMTFKPRAEGRTNPFVRLGPPAAFTLAWSVMAGLSAVHGPMAMKFAALVILFGLIVEGLKYATVSRSAMLSILPGPFLALILVPMLGPKFTVLDKAVALVVLAGLAGYAIDAVRLMRGAARALERAQAEALEASRAKSAFLAMMSHELRTPMNGVLGLAHAMRGTALDPRQAEYLEMIEQSSHGLMTILNDILDLSKIEAGKLELEVAPFDIRKLAAQIRLVWSETARLKGLELVLDIDPDTPAWLSGDAARVRQILMNLVSNALKFTEAGRVTVRIASAAGDAGDGIVVAVSDTGIGLSDEQRARLFTPFAQGDRTIARRFGGTGLGLAICRQLVEMMDGEIGVESVAGQGSTFAAHLPLPAARALSDFSGPVAALDLAGARVLVVDDNVVNQTVARAILEAVGVSVATVGDGYAALARLRVEDFDVVLMDVHMPEMDGVEAVRRIRAGEGGRVDLPVVALTADAMVGDAERLLAQGFDDAHPKPIQPAGLLATVAGLRTPVTRARAAA
ncbi:MULTISPECIES: ATP-binding protein [unclassified Caulobacter]|uniref:ATP-binding protein n=1 Tax=unclassified Caulobacter TaxID=2648921 RepID=UPI001F1F0C46|nr:MULTISPECIES: ATP-binding protein [unclassified Caulobacter]